MGKIMCNDCKQLLQTIQRVCKGKDNKYIYILSNSKQMREKESEIFCSEFDYSPLGWKNSTVGVGFSRKSWIDF